MFDPDKNLISLSNEDGSGDELQRAQAAWFLSVLCMLDAEGKDEWATKDLAIVRRWYGLDSSVSLIDAAGKTTKIYADLQDVFAATYIAWLIEGANLPPVAEAVAKPLRQKYSSANQVRGAKLDDEIGRLFRGVLENESKDQPPLTAGTGSTGKSFKPKSQPLERGRTSLSAMNCLLAKASLCPTLRFAAHIDLAERCSSRFALVSTSSSTGHQVSELPFMPLPAM